MLRLHSFEFSSGSIFNQGQGQGAYSSFLNPFILSGSLFTLLTYPKTTQNRVVLGQTMTKSMHIARCYAARSTTKVVAYKCKAGKLQLAGMTGREDRYDAPPSPPPPFPSSIPQPLTLQIHPNSPSWALPFLPFRLPFSLYLTRWMKNFMYILI